MKRCEEVRDMISLYIDNGLSEEESKEIEKHIESCEVCKVEFNELENLIKICQELPDEDLPPNFRENLHRRLVEEKAKEDRKRFAAIRNRYLKICSTIAAGILIIVLTKSFWSDLLLRPSYDLTSDSVKSKSAELNSDKNIFESSDAKVKTNEGKNSDTADEKQADSSDVQINAFVPEGNDVTAAGILPNKEAESAQAYSRSFANSANNKAEASNKIRASSVIINRTASYTIKAEADSDSIKIVENIAKENSAEIQYTLDANSLKQSKEVALNYRVPNDKFDNFINSLKSSFGSSLLQNHPTEERDVTQEVQDLQNKLSQLSAEIEEKSQVSSPEELVGLEKEKADVEMQLNELLMNQDYTICTVVIKDQ